MDLDYKEFENKSLLYAINEQIQKIAQKSKLPKPRLPQKGHASLRIDICNESAPPECGCK